MPVEDLPTWCNPLIEHIQETDKEITMTRDVPELIREWFYLRETYNNSSFIVAAFDTNPDKDLILDTRALLGRAIDSELWTISPVRLYEAGLWGEAYELMMDGTHFKIEYDEWGVAYD